MISVCIDNFGFADNGYSLGRIRKMLVRVAMNKICRAIAVDQAVKTFKSFVTGVFGIVNETRRRVRNNDIDTAIPPDPGSQFQKVHPHLVFSVLMRAAIVPARPLQPQEVEPLVFNQAVVEIGASVKRCGIIADVVIAKYVIKGCVKDRGQAVQVFRG